MKKLIILTLAMAVMMSLFAGCGGSSDSSPVEESQEDSVVTTAQETETTTAEQETEAAATTTAEPVAAASLYLDKYVMSFLQAEEVDPNPPQVPNGRYVRVIFEYEAVDDGSEGIVWNEFEKSVEDGNINLNDISLTDESKNSYPALSYGTTDVNFSMEEGFSTPDLIQNIFFEFDIPSDAEIESLSFKYEEQILPLN